MSKNILITGVSSGIGHDATRYLVDQGFRVFGSVRKDADKLRLEKEFPQQFHALQFDVTDKAAIIAASKKVEKLLQGEGLDVLINNAGFASPGPMLHMADETFEYQMQVNLFGLRMVTNAFAPMLGASKDFKGKPGKIINVSSISGLFNNPFSGAYCVSKHAVESISEVYRREFLMYGIDVVTINPGPIASEIWDKNLGKLDAYLDTDYGPILKKANDIIEHTRDNALPLEATSKLIYKIIQQPKPKLMNIIHNQNIAFFLMRKLPKRWVDKLINSRLRNDNIKAMR